MSLVRNALLLLIVALTIVGYGMGARIAYAEPWGQQYLPPTQDVSMRLAMKVWRSPCYGEISVVTADLPDRPDFDVAARAEWTYGRVYTDCLVLLDEEWPQWKPEYLCSVLLHETGPLSGMPHSENPRSVMFWIVPTDRRCVRLFRKVPANRRLSAARPASTVE